MVKKRFQNRGRRFRKKRGSKLSWLAPRSYMGRVVKRKINFFYTIFAVSNASLTGNYSFLSTVSQSSTTLTQSVNSSIAVSNEFLEMKRSYSLFKINGIKVKWLRTLVDSSQPGTDGFLAFPPLSFDLFQEASTAITPGMVYESDTALTVQPMEASSRGVSKYFKFPPYIATRNGYPCCGSSTWMMVSNYTVNGNQYLTLAMGHPSTLATVGSADKSLQVGIIECTAYCDFAKPMRTVDV